LTLTCFSRRCIGAASGVSGNVLGQTSNGLGVTDGSGTITQQRSIQVLSQAQTHIPFAGTIPPFQLLESFPSLCVELSTAASSMLTWKKVGALTNPTITPETSPRASTRRSHCCSPTEPYVCSKNWRTSEETATSDEKTRNEMPGTGQIPARRSCVHIQSKSISVCADASAVNNETCLRMTVSLEGVVMMKRRLLIDDRLVQ